MSFDQRWAEIYGDIDLRGDEESTVAFLAELARGGPALELAIGTGRIALPLSAHGIRVDGVDFSPTMLEKLRAKPGGDRIDARLGDFADVPIDGAYRLVYVLFNTLFNLLSQDRQVQCFENVAAHLTDDGLFVVEGCMTPDFLSRLNHDQYVQAEAVGIDHARLDLLRHDAATQTIEEVHVTLSTDGIKFNPVVQRYAWPAELDLMARIAGLRLLERWGTWDRAPYSSASENVVSVYGR